MPFSNQERVKVPAVLEVTRGSGGIQLRAGWIPARVGSEREAMRIDAPATVNGGRERRCMRKEDAEGRLGEKTPIEACTMGWEWTNLLERDLSQWLVTVAR